MLDQRAVLKEGGAFVLSASWVLDRLGQLQLVYDRLCGRSLTSESIPLPGKRVQWRFQTLRQMDRFWVHLMFLLFETCRESVMLQAAPRLWFPHIDPVGDAQNLRAMRIKKAKIKILVGGDSYLDRLPGKAWPKEVYQCFFQKTAFSADRTHYYCSIGEYLITVKIPPKIAAEIDALFDRVTSQREFSKAEQFFLFDAKVDPVISVERATKKSELISRKLAHEFARLDRLA